MSSSASSSSGNSSLAEAARYNPVLRNALRYTISAKEYDLLHAYLLSRAPQPVQKRTPPPKKYEAIVKGKSNGEDFNAAAVRASLRLFASSYTALKLYELLMDKIRGPKGKATTKPRGTTLRLSASISLLLFTHRLLYRFLTRLRTSLLTPSATPFRRRNPRIASLLTSPLTPSLGASLSGLSLSIAPASKARVSASLYVLVRGLEVLWNDLERRNTFGDPATRRKWFGSWMLMPLAWGQLFWALVCEPGCFPGSYADLFYNSSPGYAHPRPANYPGHLPWPEREAFLAGLKQIGLASWPAFTSPILKPNTAPLPSALAPIAPVTTPAHPRHTRLSCALLHPRTPSCSVTYTSYALRALPRVARFFTVLYAAVALLKYKAFLKRPIEELESLAKKVIKMSVFVTGLVGTSWGTLCLLQRLLPRGFIPTKRFFVSGFLAGLWAYLVKDDGRDTVFLWAMRESVLSGWSVGRKRGWWRGVRGGEVGVFVVGLAVMNVVFEGRRGVGGTGDGMVDGGLRVLRGRVEESVGSASVSASAGAGAGGEGEKGKSYAEVARELKETKKE